MPLPNHDTDWVSMTEANMVNQFIWSQDKKLRAWMRNNRLDGYSKLLTSVDKSDTKKMAILSRMRKYSLPAMLKLQQLQKGLDAMGRAPLKTHS